MQRLGDGESRVVTVRISVEDYAKVEAWAREAGETVSEYVRGSLVNFGNRSEKVAVGPKKAGKCKVKRDEGGYCRHGMMGRCGRCEGE